MNKRAEPLLRGQDAFELLDALLDANHLHKKEKETMSGGSRRETKRTKSVGSMVMSVCKG